MKHITLMDSNPVLAIFIISAPFLIALLIFLACIFNWMPHTDESHHVDRDGVGRKYK